MPARSAMCPQRRLLQLCSSRLPAAVLHRWLLLPAKLAVSGQLGVFAGSCLPRMHAALPQCIPPPLEPCSPLPGLPRRIVGTANALAAGWGNAAGGMVQLLMPLLLQVSLQVCRPLKAGRPLLLAAVSVRMPASLPSRRATKAPLGCSSLSCCRPLTSTNS
jgi:hypothetical protein